ncbi:MAG: hypothetical protein ACI4VL_02885 [Bacilli bacterium]
MKKLFILSILFLSFFSISKVSADTIEFEFDDSTSTSGYFTSLVYSFFSQEIIDSMENTMVNYWKENLKSHHPYYFISLNFLNSNVSGRGYDTLQMSITALKAIPINYSSFVSICNDYDNYSDDTISFEDKLQLTYYFDYYNGETHGYNGEPYGLYVPASFIFNNSTKNYLSGFYYNSNFDLKFDLEDTYTITKDVDLSFTLNKNDIIPTYKSLYLEHVEENYKEIDLNNYAYIALSLKDYSKEEEFNTTVKVKGQYCLTPVYNYGMTERKDILSGTQVERCSPYYDSFTPVRTYILKSDLENHAIYYLKAYDTSKENKVQVDTSIFDITYITEDNKDNPYVTINGKTYPTIPYDSLTDTSTKSEDEGYASGASCAVGDFNCTRDVLGIKGFSWSDIFTSPIDFLKKIWQGIVNVFTLINYFISILPTTLQYFLYISFMLAIILGLIKIIL